MQKRIHKKNDLIHTVEAKTFRIIEPISQGGFSVVYRAEEMIGAEVCPVLLKAYTMDNSISDRSEWESLIRHELLMNRKISGSGFAGALTMEYTVHGKADGSIYGVMPAEHPGKTLREYIESDEFRYSPLRDRMIMGKKLFRLIQNFHTKCSIIHGDITPDNIYLLDTDNDGIYEKNAVFALLDFGQSQEIEDDKGIVTGYTEGYARAEIQAGTRTRLLELDDWYGVLHCFWYCFTGHSVDEYPVTREHIEQTHRQLSVRYEAVSFESAEEMALLKLREEHYEVVESLLENIFLNMDTLTEEVIDLTEQILGILDDTGISRERLYAKLLEEYKSLRSTRFAGLNIVRRILPNAGFEMTKGTARFYRHRSNKPEPLQQIMKSCKDSLFMLGDGGMGKTTSLINIMDDTYGEDINIGNPVIFMELCTLSQNYEEWYSPERGGTFIEQFIASYYTNEPRKYVSADHPYISPLREELYRSPKKGIRQYTLLLDGLNEIGFINDKSRKIFFKVLNHYLKYAKNLRIILTGRTDTFELDTDVLLRIHAEGLEDIHIEGVLLEAVEKKSLSESDYHRIVSRRHEMVNNEYRLWQCLRIPFFLMMYCMMSEKHSVTRQGEILKNFFHDKRETLDGSSVYGEKQQAQSKQRNKKYGEQHDLRMDLSIRIVLDFVVPEIACKMVMDNLFFIEPGNVKEEVRSFLESEEQRGGSQNWRKWFYGYEINVQEILAEIDRIDGGERIPEYACDVLGIMRRTANGAYFFTHQYFRDYFAACAVINRMLYLLEVKSIGYAGLAAGNPLFEELIYPFQERKLSPYIAALIGEILGECRNLPVYHEQTGMWAFSEKTGSEQTILSQLLDCYRIQPGMEWNNKTALGLSNLFAIFKNCRVQNDGRIDLSGLSLHHLNLHHISLAGVVLSRFNRNGEPVLTTDFEGSDGVLDAFLYDESVTRVQCLAVHPVKKRILLWDQINGTLTEVDLEHGETILICEHMERVRYAAYNQQTDEIYMVTYLSDVSDVKRKGNKLEKFFRFVGIEAYAEEYEDDFLDEDFFDYNDYDPRIFEGEEIAERETRIYTYHRSTGLVLTTRKRGEEPVASQWSEAYQELSVMLQNPLGEMELFKNPFFMENDKLSRRIAREKIYSALFSPECMDTVVLGLESFAIDRVSETEYVFTDFEEWNGNVGIWDIKTGNVQSICYKDKDTGKEALAAICGNKNGEIFALKRGLYRSGTRLQEPYDIMYRQYQYKDKEVSGYSLQQQFMLHKDMDCKMEFLQDHLLLSLSNGELRLISLDKKGTGWVSGLSVQSYCRSDAGYLIATCDDGLYEINMLDGSTTCIQKFMKKQVAFVLGRTSSTDSVVLLENSGIVKWLDLGTGCCSRFVTIQCPKLTKDFQIYADETNHTIMAISGDRVTIWDAYSGATIKSYSIELPKDEILLGREIIEGDIVFYFEQRNYKKFPMEQRYWCKIWNVEKTQWETEKLPEFLRVYRKEPFRLHLAEDGSSYALECVDKNARTKNWRNAGHKGKGFLDSLLDIIVRERDDEEDRLIKTVTEWKLGTWLQDKKRFVLYQAGKGHQRKIAVMDSDEILLGLTTEGVVLLKVSDEMGTVDVYVTDGHRQRQYDFGALEGTLRSTFTVKNTLVLHVSDDNNTRSRILFWNMADKIIYGYNATENLMITGCKDVSEPEQQKNRKSLLEMQGVGDAVKHIMGKVHTSEDEQEIALNKWKDRFKSWNVPALICCLLLCGISTFVLFKADTVHLLRNSYGISYYFERIAKALIQLLIMLVCMKTFLPYFIKCIKKEQFFGVGGPIIIALFCVVVIWMTSPGLIVFWFRIDMLVVLWIPLACWYSLNRPRRRILWFLLLILMVVSIMYSTIYLKEYYSTIQLLQLVFVAMMTIVIAEFSRNRRSFWIGLTKVGIVVVGTVGAVWYILQSREVFAWRIESMESRISYMKYWWGSLNNQCMQVLQKAGWFGGVETEYALVPRYDDAYSMDYLQRYFINFVIQEYGLVLGIVTAAIAVIFVVSLFRGAIRQICKLDRCICMSCAAYFAIQLVIALPANFGFQWLPPYKIDFLNIYAGSWLAGILALSVYMAFYKAHRQMR